jgi:diguanylate cyclase (GGDEF)-like protein/PAS domain S-box-containing protein
VELAPFLSQSLTVYDREGRVRAHLGPPRGLLGHASHFLKVGRYCHPDDRPALTEITAAVIDSEPGWCGGGHLRLRRADGTWGTYEIQAWNLYGQPPLDGIVVRMAEVTEDPGTTLLGPVAELGLDLDPSIAAAARTASITLDRHGAIRHVTPAAEQLLGWTDDDLYGRDVTAVVDEPDRVLVQGQIATMAAREERTVVGSLRNAAGEVIPTEIRLVGGARDPLSLITVVLTDRRRDPELVRLATTDPLTGLANRARLLDVLAGALGSAAPVAVLYADVDGLKQVNDSLGHAVGDDVIVEVARTLSAMAGPGCTVGRIGGDEFVVVGVGVDHGVEALADRLRRRGVVDAGVQGPVTVSTGLARSRPDDTPQTLLARADAAMFEHKRAGRSESR